MQDRETESLWSQISGECIQGKMKGKHLNLVPSFHTTFAEFQKLYPQGLVLRKPERGDAESGYADYMGDPKKLGIFGRMDNFEKLPAKSKIYGLRLGEEQVAIAAERLTGNGWVVVTTTTPPVLVTYDTAGHTAAAFALAAPTIASPQTISVKNNIVSTDGGQTAWDARTGRVVKGTAPNLTPVPLLSAYWFAWASFFPATAVVD